MDEQQLHQIGAVADRVGLSLRTIRHYEEVGLVIPSGRSAGGFRLYTDADVDRLAQVKAMKPLGFSLEETSTILALRRAVAEGTAASDQRARLESFASRAEEQCSRLSRQLDEVRRLTVQLREQVDRAERSVARSG
jgi:MerR family transcriptional regulator, copper efflux regulator